MLDYQEAAAANPGLNEPASPNTNSLSFPPPAGCFGGQLVTQFIRMPDHNT
jgi:hypothetical protein